MESSIKIEEKIKHAISDYNALCEKHRLRHRFKYYEQSEKLVMGTTAQFEYGSYQCELVQGREIVLEFIRTSNMILCFEKGE